MFTVGGYIDTPSDDPAFLYQDVTIAIAPERRINNGQPVLHAASLGVLNVTEGETVVHIGAGTGYYTAILAQLVGSTGTVIAYEVEKDLAERAATNLVEFTNVKVRSRSGAEGSVPQCSAIYVSAGATHPLDARLNALRENGRLLFPLTPDGPGGTPAGGAMLLIKRCSAGDFDARFVFPVVFIPCLGARDTETVSRLAQAFQRGDWPKVRSLRRNSTPDESCWFSGNGWWLSMAEVRST